MDIVNVQREGMLTKALSMKKDHSNGIDYNSLSIGLKKSSLLLGLP